MRAAARALVALWALLVGGCAARDANVAYFVQVSDATFPLLPRLMRALWDDRNLHVVHFDKKIPKWQKDHTIAALFASNKEYKRNVHVMESEIVAYRGISMVINTMNAMQVAMDMGDWDYFINISGSDYPLVTPGNQRALLGEQDFLARNRSFFSLAPRKWWDESKSYRFDRFNIDTSLSFNGSASDVVDSWHGNPLAQQLGFTFAAAESWMILHREFVHYVLTSAASRRYFAAFSYSAEPEEHMFASMAYNTPQFKATLVPHALRNVIWTYKGQHSGQHPFYIDRTNSTSHKWEFRWMVEQSGCLFTRKVRSKDAAALDEIDSAFSGASGARDEASVAAFLARVRARLACLVGGPGAALADGDDACYPGEEEETA